MKLKFVKIVVFVKCICEEAAVKRKLNLNKETRIAKEDAQHFN